MDPKILVAIVAALTSVVVSVITALISARQNKKSRQLQRELAATQTASQEVLAKLNFELQQKAKKEERRVAAEAEMLRYQEPLLAAADDVAHRLKIIREGGFLSHLNSSDTHRAEIALLGTTYRLARYWGVMERIYSEVGRVRLERDEDTETVANSIRNIGQAFANDRLDNGLFMVWREEQRAIGEIMLTLKGQRPGGAPMGFATFVEQYPNRLKRWFSTFEADLKSPNVESSERLKLLQKYFSDLAHGLGAAGRAQPENGDRTRAQQLPEPRQ